MRSITKCESISRNTYFNDGSFRWSTLASLSQQIIQINNLKPCSILEIGKGNGFVSHFLLDAGYNITTFDINRKLKPDVAGNILNLDRYFDSEQFDCVLCSEVMEHLPFNYFEKCLRMIHYVSRHNAIITLPRLQKVLFDLQMRINLPRMQPKELGIFLSIPQKKNKIFKEHFWEINSEKATALKNIRENMMKFFLIQNDFRERWRPYHHFFILQKNAL
ncbi:MAG TPA: class I SAM-dependent methyltransferase [Spirochaetota bacterium]|nr:class I SAM-dependent methyltransferase [Spirochaetota bacterium]